MTQQMIFDQLIARFPQFSNLISRWFPKGPNAIIIELLDKEELIFTFDSPLNWSLETINNYISNKRGG